MTHARIAFLGDDHMLDLTRVLLTPTGEGERAWLRGFFAPEVVDVDAVLRAGAALRGRLAVVDADADVLVLRRGAVTEETLARHPRARLVQRLGESTAGIDLAAAHARDVHVSCVPRRSLAWTAEHALLLVLALGKRLLASDRATRGWADAAGRPGDVAYNYTNLPDAVGVAGATLGLVGLGEVGRLVAVRARALGMDVLYTARTRRDAEEERTLGVAFCPLDELLARADHVSLHLSVTPATQGFIGRAELARMAPHAFLVNTSRGAVVDEDALYDALATGAIAGAGLDVHAAEPRPAGDRFAALDNVILTPHVGAGSSLRDTLPELNLMFDNIAAVLDGGAPPHPAVPAVRSA